MCVYFFQKRFFEIFHILRIKEGDKIKNAHLSSCKIPAILVRF